MNATRGTKNPLARIDFNAPVILSMTIVSLLLLGLNALLGGALTRMFAAYYSGYLDIFMYLRLFTHVLMHQNLSHFTSNFLMILAIGPMVEEKYGSVRLLEMIAITSFATGLVHVLLSHSTLLVGASGIVFMLILLASFANMQEGKIPLTVILVGVLYIGNEVIAGITTRDSVSHLSHILGGLCGAAFGFAFHRKDVAKG